MVDLPGTGTIILASDAANLQENLDKEIIPTSFDARQAWLSIRKMKVLAQIKNAQIFPGHDIEYYRQKIKKPPEMYV